MASRRRGCELTSPALPTGGLVAVAVTPLEATGAVDVPSIATLMEFYLACGVSGVALLGVMGEANRMTDAEAETVVAHAVEAIDGRIPIIVGVSDNSLARVKLLSHFAMNGGCAGVMLQPLAGLQGDRAVASYFTAAAEALGADVPICVQDFPKANGVHISVDCWRMIVEDCPSVVALKHEDEPGLDKLSALRAAEAAGVRAVTIFTGNNGIHLPQELARGSDGAMTGFAFPDVLSTVIALADQGNPDEAENLFDQYLPINRHELRLGIAVRKEILRRRGAIASAAARFPAQPLKEIASEELDRLLERLEKSTGRALTDIGAPR